MFKNEFGKIIYVNVGIDLSTATAYSIKLTKPDGTEVTLTQADGVDLATADGATPCGDILLANQYIFYTTITGDIDQTGTWKVRSIIDIDSKHLIGALDSFVVKA